MIPLDSYRRLRRRVRAKDQLGATEIMIALAFAGYRTSEIRVALANILEHADHDVHHFWLEEDCPCTKAHTN